MIGTITWGTPTSTSGTMSWRARARHYRQSSVRQGSAGVANGA